MLHAEMSSIFAKCFMKLSQEIIGIKYLCHENVILVDIFRNVVITSRSIRVYNDIAIRNNKTPTHFNI